MAQLTFSVHMDETLKKQFDALCSEFGMNVSTAINVSARAVVRERKNPFEIYEVVMEKRDDVTNRPGAVVPSRLFVV